MLKTTALGRALFAYVLLGVLSALDAQDPNAEKEKHIEPFRKIGKAVEVHDLRLALADRPEITGKLAEASIVRGRKINLLCEVDMKDESIAPPRFILVEFTVPLPDGKRLIHQSGFVNLHRGEDGRAVYSGEFRTPLKPDNYDVDLSFFGVPLAHEKLEIK